MEQLGDSGEAVRAKADLARRHAEEIRGKAKQQRARAREQREAEARAVTAAAAAADTDAELLYCARCRATWRAEEVRAATRRKPGCLMCGGPLAPAPND
jgi:ElaB/YqjD/DUF883 family membrane-anchored ribosome-binding protein